MSPVPPRLSSAAAALCAAAVLASACQARAQSPTGGIQAGPSMEYDPQIITVLLKLLEDRDRTRPAVADFTKPPFKDIIVCGTPGCYHLKNRYLRLGIPLSQALQAATDERLRAQSLELARWERSSEIRAVGLLALAARRDPAHLRYFREALMNIEPEVRFASLEALENWGLEGAEEEFKKTARDDRSPIVRVYAAQALAKRGNPYGLEVLRNELNSGSWVARAMSALYLGDHGQGQDYDRCLDRMTMDQGNDFVVAEMAIAALKLFPRKSGPAGGATSPPAPLPGQAPPPMPPGRPGLSMDLFVDLPELPELVITAPRLKIPPTLMIDGRINATLLRLLENNADARPKEEDLQDSGIQALQTLSSPKGFLLKTRYTELGFLLTEGLAGTADLVLREKIIKVARSGSNSQVRAAALLAVAYEKRPEDRGLFQEALLSQNITVRFGGLEALRVWGGPGAISEVANVARTDLSAPLRMYAADMMQRMGDASGRDLTVRGIDDMEWLIRAMANRSIGEFGAPRDFDRILFNMSREDNNFVRAEMCGALLRLHSLRSRNR